MKKIISIICLILSENIFSAEGHPKCFPNPCDEVEQKNTKIFKNISLAELDGLKIGAKQIETMKLMNGLRPTTNDASKNLRSVGCGEGWKCNFKIADTEVKYSQLTFDQDKLISAIFQFNPEAKTEISKKGYKVSIVYSEVYKVLQSKYGNESIGVDKGGPYWIFGDDDIVIGLHVYPIASTLKEVSELEFFDKKWQIANRVKPKVNERASEIEGK